MKQVLVIQTAFLGDAVLVTSILEKLHAQYPDAAIDLVVRKGNEGLFTGHPFLHRVHVWDKRQGKTRALFKLMAIKDEYEVARLMTAPAFAAELAERFEGDFSVTYHMAPPLLPLGRDGRGRPKKRAFGPWMTPVLRGLAGMKRLRFTPLDPFALSHDRRMDRALLRWFEAVLDRIAADHAAIGADTARAVLAAPMEIRGYGPVREAAAQAVLAQVQALWPQAPMPRWKPAIASSAAPAAVS